MERDGHVHGDAAPALGAAVRYRPVVSLLDGSAFGYEAVPERPSGSAEAARAGTAEGKREPDPVAFWEAVLGGLPEAVKKGRAKLMAPLPRPSSQARDAEEELSPEALLRLSGEAGLTPGNVVLTLSDEEAADPETEERRRDALLGFRAAGFRIALAGVVPRRNSLRRLLELHPDYARVDVGWSGDERPDAETAAGKREESGRVRKAAALADEALLGAIAGLARDEQIVLIADGVSGESQLGVLAASGIGYGQGSWLGPAEERPGGVRPDVRDRIRRETAERYRSEAGALSELAVTAETFPSDTPISDIVRQFERRRDAQGFAIAEEGRPVGLIMKEKLHQLMSGQFGPALYWKRPVAGVMDKQPLIMDEGTPVELVSRMAMAREPDKLYDAVIVTRAGLTAGLVSIRSLLEWVTRRNIKDARGANPLTGLPGNEPIHRELSRRIGEGRPFSVLYADLNRFKWYNDRYGFRQGDEVIRYTGETIVSAVRTLTPEEGGFVGHIGGDDFIALLPGLQSVSLCSELLKRFDRGIGTYGGRDTGPVLDRDGLPTADGGLSLSLSLLLCERTDGWTPELLAERAALLKKEAKRQTGSALVWEMLREPGESGGKSSITVGVKSS
ncbi:diguanylate cyclase domain-containing protein [Cohnella zeiphila]|uniref:Diguanylate cyclase n=1 Tax=Cohnella zeiphila TaxID=2761120 RepID=A0A7X0SMC7_9BACL|nr:diguanylate cyclase [Cohnella zeiphila]MBB6732658.1 diguanylate cyclase [Cohnella zeiphila]